VDLDALEHRAVGGHGQAALVGGQQCHRGVLDHPDREVVREVGADLDRVDDGALGGDPLERLAVEVERRHPLGRGRQLGADLRRVRRDRQPDHLDPLDPNERRVAEPDHVGRRERQREQRDQHEAPAPVGAQRRGEARDQAARCR
jgi:hypothetical protein